MPGAGLILAIESSCDETAAAVVERGERTLSSVVASQIATHARYGGVVPELASREHLRAVVPVVRAALAQANITLNGLDAVAVTSGPGLAGALLVGITYAKALAFAQDIPLIAINHLEGHIHAALLNESLPDGQRSKGGEPALALVVSGGHTHLYLADPVETGWHYSLMGRTLDDAAGEAFDKVAKLLGLPYPGGPWIDALALFGNPQAVPFAFSQIKPKIHLLGKAPRTKAARSAPIANLDPHFLFSFSGIKTAVLRYTELHNLRPQHHDLPANPDGPGLALKTPPKTRAEALAVCPQETLDLIASFQHAVVGDLMKKTFAAAESLGATRILVTGAEAAHRALRIVFPTLALSTDNAAMIAAAAWPRFQAGEFSPLSLCANPSLSLGVEVPV